MLGSNDGAVMIMAMNLRVIQDREFLVRVNNCNFLLEGSCDSEINLIQVYPEEVLLVEDFQVSQG
jgi:hypothetical protein